MPLFPRSGERVAGYRLEREIGHGATGVVHVARDEATGGRVALKVVVGDLAADPGYRERFVREARAAAELHHENVVTVLRSGEEEGLLWLAMRLIDGPDLRVLLRRTGRLGPEQAVSVVEQIAAGLDAAHAAGIVHRDVKPANVLVEDGPGNALHVELADFGLARPPGRRGPGARGGAGRGARGAAGAEGTPGYAAPEQLAGADPTRAADIHGLGCILLEMLTGTPPPPVGRRAFGAGPASVAAERDARRPSRWVPGLGEAYDGVVLGATEVDPAARPATAGAVAVAARRALEASRRGARPPAAAPEVRAAAAVPPTDEEIAEGATAAVTHPTPVEPPPRTLVAVRRSRRRPLLALLLLLLVLAAGSAYALTRHATQEPGRSGAGTTTAGTGGSPGSPPSHRAAGGGAHRGAHAGGTGAAGGAAASSRSPGSSATGSPSSTSSGREDQDGGPPPPAAARPSVGAKPIRSVAPVPRVPAAAPGIQGAAVMSLRAGDERFGGGAWTLDLPRSAHWRQVAAQELDGGRRLVVRLLRPDGIRVVVVYLPARAAVYGPWDGRPFVVGLPRTGRTVGRLFRGGRYAMCRRGTCGALSVNGASGGVLLVAGARTAAGARRVVVRAARGLRVR